jgi:hypothetical protein
MSDQFSFIGYPALVILKNSKLLVPGIERVDVVYFDPFKKKVCAKMSRKQGDDYLIEDLSVGSVSKKINNLRQRKAATEWYGKTEIPYNLSSAEANNKDIFGELDKVVMMARVPNNFDGKSDLVFFYFATNMSNFTISGNKKDLTPKIKDVIARNIRNSLLMVLTNAANDQRVLQMISENMAAVGQNLENMNRKLNLTQNKYQESLVISCNHYLEKFSRQNKRSYSFSEAAIQRIKEYDGEFHKLEGIISRAIEIADNLVYGILPAKVILTESHLNFSFDETPAQDSGPLEHGIYSFAAKFLNRIEAGCFYVKKQNMSLTSKNVASSLDNPVKPPAISYMVNYHTVNIKELFKLYPDKWQLLKSEFKPTMKLVEKHLPSTQENSGAG